MAAFLLGGCGSIQFEPQLVKSFDMEWPPKPNLKKVEYLGEIKRFSQTNHTLASLILGKNDAGEIVHPVSIAIGVDGRTAIADTKLKGVHLYIPSQKKYELVHKAGNTYLQSPVSVCFDKNLFLYVSDSLLRKVFVYDSHGKVTKILDRTEQTLFGRPTGLSIDNQTGQIFIVDTTRNEIHTFDSQHNYLFSFGNKGTEDSEFNLPTHITTDSKGRLFINDTMNFRLQIYHPTRGFISKFGHHGNGSGDFAMPKGVGVDRSGVIYVVDSLFDNIQLFDEKGTFLLTIGSRGLEAGQFWLPSGIFIDHEDKMYVCDTYNKRIQVFQLFDNQL
jgi:sugar lactone lactonase YvrE